MRAVYIGYQLGVLFYAITAHRTLGVVLGIIACIVLTAWLYIWSDAR